MFTVYGAICNSIILMNSFSGGQPAGGKHNSHSVQFHSLNEIHCICALQ